MENKEQMELIIELLKVQTKYNVLINYMINNAELSYTKQQLRIDDCAKILKTLEPEKYDSKLDILINEKIITK